MPGKKREDGPPSDAARRAAGRERVALSRERKKKKEQQQQRNRKTISKTRSLATSSVHVRSVPPDAEGCIARRSEHLRNAAAVHLSSRRSPPPPPVPPPVPTATSTHVLAGCYFPPLQAMHISLLLLRAGGWRRRSTGGWRQRRAPHGWRADAAGRGAGCIDFPSILPASLLLPALPCGLSTCLPASLRPAGRCPPMGTLPGGGARTHSAAQQPPPQSWHLVPIPCF